MTGGLDARGWLALLALAGGCGFDLGRLQSGADAGVDGGRDGGRDAATDGAVDAAEDAETDAGERDADIDAEPPDAGDGDGSVPCVPADCEDGDPCTMNFCGPAGCEMRPATDGTACGSWDPRRDPPSACCGGVCTDLGSESSCGGCGVTCAFGICLQTLTAAGVIVRCRCNDVSQCPEAGDGFECTSSACECRVTEACAPGAVCMSEGPYMFCAYP